MNPQNKVLFQKDGSPYSSTFADIYFDTQDGCRQSEQVFINSNNIKSRLVSTQAQFTIAETGFGSGLNFFLTLALYQQVLSENPQSTATLLFISVEKYPLTAAQITQSLKIWPALAPLVETFIAQYPYKLVTNDIVEMTFFNGKVSFVLYINDATVAFQQIKKTKTGLVDAWYLDGFAPAQNPDMWTDALFEQVALLSKEQATLGTFTIAGKIRRGLTAVGFRLRKKLTSGKKKESLVGVFQQSTKFGKGYQLRPKITKPMHVSLIGGGIASACVAYALTKAGIKVNLYCQENTVAQGASSNLMGALYPLLHQQKDDISLFYQQAFWRARSLYDEVLTKGFKFAHDWCGVLDIAYKQSLKKHQQQFNDIGAWPAELIHSVDAAQASTLANIALLHGGLFMPNAGWISPPELVKALLAAANASNRLRIHTGTKVSEIKALENDQWQLMTNNGDITTETLIVCGGAETAKINIVNQLPLAPVRGQVSNMRANNHLANLTTVICHKGYLTPSYKNQQCIGATFEKNTFNTQAKTAEDSFNLKMLNECLPELTAGAQWQLEDIYASKARLRCMTPDHLPVVGVMPKIAEHKTSYRHLAKDKNWRYQTPAPHYKNLYVLTGLGARGLCSAPLLADILTADLTGEPYPVDNQMLFNVAPNRFIIRDIIKRKVDV
ncbi:MAG: bifunctional tRNA (5-methylaminomethyl-2-thiouridine)(34)-methyltransferase MnmD/FAD-dependent 5-carboxymethylaminomethyl-2-thiouridine(34) oxidoreductase MnmC [Thalassotalea sp.]